MGSNPVIPTQNGEDMRHNAKYDEEKKLRRLWNQYRDTWRLVRDHGTWIKVDPYQKGWIRRFDLRDDIKNRMDAADIRQVLEMLNSQVYCKTKDFVHHNWRTGKEIPIEQKLKRLTTEQYEKLSEKHKSYFVRTEVLEVFTHPFHRRMWFTRYEFKHDFWFVYVIEPNMIEYHWMPDPEWESHCAEISNKIDKNNLWPKINKMLGVSSHDREWREGPYYKNKYGEIEIEEDLAL